MFTLPVARPLLLLVTLTVVSGCGSSKTPEALGTIDPIWTYDAPGRVRGVVVGADGEVVLAVAPGDAPFEDGGGAMIFDEEGGLLASVPMVIPLDCDVCTRLMFYPGAPLAGSRGDTWLGDRNGNLFRLPAAGGAERIRLQDPDDLGAGIFGVDAASALAPDGDGLFLAGLKLLAVEIDGRISQAVDFGASVRKVVRGDDTTYWLDVTEAFSETGAVIRWDPVAGARERIDLLRPVVGLASAEGWTVAALDVGPGRVALYELGETAPTALVDFDLPSGPVHLALRPALRQVVVASGGIGVVEEDGVSILVGGALLVDAVEGPLAAGDVSSVLGIALSADGRLAFVADTGGLKAFELP